MSDVKDVKTWRMISRLGVTAQRNMHSQHTGGKSEAWILIDGGCRSRLFPQFPRVCKIQ
jgi:hypothetical protein